MIVEVHETLEFDPQPESESDVVAANAADDSTDDAVVAVAPPVRDAMTALTEQFVLATSSRPGRLDWDIAEMLLERADGIPVIVGRQIKDAATSAASE